MAENSNNSELQNFTHYEYFKSLQAFEGFNSDMGKNNIIKLRTPDNTIGYDIVFNISGNTLIEDAGNSVFGTEAFIDKNRLVEINIFSTTEPEIELVHTPYGKLAEHCIGANGELYRFSSTYLLDSKGNEYRYNCVRHVNQEVGINILLKFPLEDAPRLDFTPQEADSEITPIDDEGKKDLDEMIKAIESDTLNRLDYENFPEVTEVAFPPSEYFEGYSQEYEVPDSPVPKHKRRPGEPPLPVFIPRKELDLNQYSKRIMVEKKRNKKWREWAQKQPDWTMLELENTFLTEWARYTINWNRPVDDDLYNDLITGLPESMKEYAAKLRADGHGDLLDNYWPELLNYEYTYRKKE